MAGIGCEFCAYCFDEALLMRERAEQAKARDEANQRAEIERAKAATSRMARTGEPE